MCVYVYMYIKFSLQIITAALFDRYICGKIKYLNTLLLTSANIENLIKFNQVFHS
jgi:hypothetical protein